jgi:hypothetical protein
MQNRDHVDFMLRLNRLLPSRQALVDGLCDAVQAVGFTLQVRWSTAVCNGAAPSRGHYVLQPRRNVS